MSAEWLAARLRKLKLGEQLELRGLGRSLWPLVRSGDRLLVEAALPDRLRRGDLVIAWVAQRQTLVCHVLIGTMPPRTAPLLGGDDGEVEVLAKVVRVQGRPAALDRMVRSRSAVLALSRVGRFARRKGWSTRVREGLESIQGARRSAVARTAILGPFEIRQLELRDLESLVIFTGHHLPALSAEWLEKQFHGPWSQSKGGGFAAFDRRKRMRAFGYLGGYSDEGVEVPGLWLRSLYTEAAARRLGLSRRLLLARLTLAVEQGAGEVFVDIRRDNVPSMHLHLKHGFVEVPPEELAPFAPLISRSERRGHKLVILRWRATASPAPT